MFINHLNLIIGMAIKAKPKKKLVKIKEPVLKKTVSGVHYIDTKKQGFLEKNLLPYSFPLIVVGLIFLLLFVLNLTLLFQDSPEFYVIRFLYFLLLLGFFLWSLLICAIFGTLTNFIILNGLMPLLNCSLEKLDLKNYLKLPLLVFSFLLLSLVISAGVLLLNPFFGLNNSINVSYLVIFALFLGSIIMVKRTLTPACKSGFLSYLVSLVFVLINYVQFLVIFTTIFLILILTIVFVFFGIP